MINFFHKKKGNRGDTLSSLLEENISALKKERTAISDGINKLKKKASDYKSKTANTISKSADHLIDTQKRCEKACSDIQIKAQKELYKKQDELLTHTIPSLVQYGEQVKFHVVSYSEKLLKICTTTIIGFAEIVKAVLDFSRKNDDAFKFKLLEAKKNAVYVGIFDEQNLPLTEIQIESTNGVANNLKTNKWYYINEY